MRGSIERVLAALEQANVDYVVVGGVAVVLHGHLRTTADLDLVVRLSDDNALRAVEALTRLGMRPRLPVPAEDFADASKRGQWIATKGLTVFSFWDPNDPPFVVDLFAEEPFDFIAVHQRARRVPLTGTTAVVVGLEDLLAMKRAVGRPIDLDDVVHDSKWDWDAARREQLRAALRMTPVERLQWLEDTTAQMRDLLGRARGMDGDAKSTPVG